MPYALHGAIIGLDGWVGRFRSFQAGHEEHADAHTIPINAHESYSDADGADSHGFRRETVPAER